jgi:hypothetical protein
MVPISKINFKSSLKSINNAKLERLLIAFLIFSAIKIIITLGNEIVSEGSDSEEYFLLAKAWFWWYDEMPIRGPGFPIYVAILHLLKLPLRVTSEILFILSASWFCYSLLRIKLPISIILLVFISLLFHPLVFYNFDMPMSESLFSILLLIMLGASIQLLFLESFRSKLMHCAVIGFSSAFMIQTRPSDSLLIYAIIAEILICNYLITILSNNKILIWRAILASICTIFIVVFIGFLVSLANYKSFGVFSENQINDSAKLHLIHTLMRIDTGEAPIHPRIPVTTQARHIAYDLSPSMKSYKHLIEGQSNAINGNKFFTFGRTGIEGQLDLEDTLAVIKLLCNEYNLKDPEAGSGLRGGCDSKLNKISDEISSALDAKKANSRTVFFIITPSFKMVVNTFFKSISNIFNAIFYAPDEPVIDYYPFYGSLDANLYNQIGGRNPRLVSKGPLEGFLAVPKAYQVKSISFVNGTDDFFHDQMPSYFSSLKQRLKKNDVEIYEYMGGAEFTSTFDKNSMPDLLNKIEIDDQYTVMKFTIPAVHDRVFLHFTKLIVTLNDGQQINIKDIDKNIIKKYGIFSPDNLNLELYAVITSFELALSPLEIAGYTAQKWIYRSFNNNAKTIGCLLVLLIFIGLFLLALKSLLGKMPRLINVKLFCVFGILLSVVFFRVIYYAFVDAVIFPINIDRHLFAASILFFPIAIILCHFSITGSMRNIKEMWVTSRVE